MKTINQINNFVLNNQTIQFYLECSEHYYNRKEKRYLRMSSNDRSGSCLGSFIFGSANRYLKSYCGIEKTYFHLHSTDQNIYFTAQINFDGCWLILNHYNDPTPYDIPKRTKIKDNFLPTKENFQKQIDNFVAKYLFPEGKWRDIQVYFGCSKKEVIEKYKQYLLEKPITEEIDICKHYTKRLRKKYNCEFEYDISMSSLLVKI